MIIKIYLNQFLLNKSSNFLLIYFSLLYFVKNSIGTGKIIVEFFSAAMLVSVCKYLKCSDTGLLLKSSPASLNANAERCSPSAAITLALASRVASASVAIALCI